MNPDEKYIVFYKLRISKDVFECACYNHKTKSLKVVSSTDKTFIDDIIKIFSYKKFVFCSYGNYHYDDTVLAYISENNDMWTLRGLSTSAMAAEIYEFAQAIFYKPEEQWKQYKFANLFESIDLAVLLMPKKNRVSFVQAQCNLGLTIGDIKQDVYNLEYIYNNYAIKELDVRKEIHKQYDIISKPIDSVSTGMAILRSEYLKATGLQWESIKNKYSTYEYIVFNDIIFPEIKFKDGYLTDVLERIRSKTISAKDKFGEKVLWKQSCISIGLGGLHSIEYPLRTIASDDETILYVDVNSMFPAIAVTHSVYPRHLKREFMDVYASMYNDRLNASGVKRTDLKWALNAAIGMFRKENNWLCDPKAFYTITINSQMFLLMLAEALFENNNIKYILNWNTDGLYLLVDNKNIQNVHNVLNEFSLKYKLHFKTKEFTEFWQYNGNNYSAINKRSQVESNDTGIFNIEKSISKFSNTPIVSKALHDNIHYGKSIEQTIMESNDVFDFCTYYSKESGYEILYDNKPYDKYVARFYYSTKGYALNKIKKDIYTNKITSSVIISKSACKLCDNNQIFPDDVDYRYYINICNKILSEMKSVQMSLF